MVFSSEKRIAHVLPRRAPRAGIRLIDPQPDWTFLVRPLSERGQASGEPSARVVNEDYLNVCSARLASGRLFLLSTGKRDDKSAPPHSDKRTRTFLATFLTIRWGWRLSRTNDYLAQHPTLYSSLREKIIAPRQLEVSQNA